jgi:hypothetical protein
MMVKGKFHPWMVLLLAIVVGAAVFVLVLRESGVKEPQAVAVSASTLPETPAAPTGPTASTTPAITNGISSEELDRFRKNLRRTLLGRRDAMMVSPAAKELFLNGRIREALALAERELAVRTANGDRDAAAMLLGFQHSCSDPVFLDLKKNLVEGEPQMRAQLQAKTSRLAPITRAKALVAIEVSRDLTEILAASCQGPAPMDMTDLEDKVRRAAADGHTSSLTALASVAAWNRDETSRERYLLSASLLGDSWAQLSLASLYGERRAKDPNSKDRGKMRFWLEQAYDKEPSAAFDLGKCLLADCDGQPANPERGRQLIESAARQGDYPAISFMIEGGAGSEANDKFTRYAWLSFRARLADEGCDANYFVFMMDDKRESARNSFFPNDRAEADRRADELYERYGAGARDALGCN